MATDPEVCIFRKKMKLFENIWSGNDYFSLGLHSSYSLQFEPRQTPLYIVWFELGYTVDTLIAFI